MRAIFINKLNAKCCRCKITHPKTSCEVHFISFFFIFDFVFTRSPIARFFPVHKKDWIHIYLVIAQCIATLNHYSFDLDIVYFIFWPINWPKFVCCFLANGKCLSLKCATFSRSFHFNSKNKTKTRAEKKSLKRKNFAKLLKIRQRERSSFPFNCINLCVGT